MRRSGDEIGFTIVEVLVASSLLILGILGTFTLVEMANAGANRAKVREGATNLAREVLEDAHDVQYARVGQQDWLTAAIAGLPGRIGAVTTPATNSIATTVARRGASYAVTASWCSVDDGKDGYGVHAAGTTWCSDSASTGTADSQPEDFKRVATDVNYSTRGVQQPTIEQVATFSAGGAAVGPSLASLQMLAPAANPPAAPVISTNVATATFRASAPGAADVRFSVNGVEQATGVVNNNNGTWDFTWPISALTDATYVIGATAVDALGVRGQPQTMPVKLARGAPVTATNVTGGYNDIWVSGSKTRVVELAWDANAEGSVTGYEVLRGATSVCGNSTSLAISCIDLAPPASGTTTYTVKTWYRDSAGTSQSVSAAYNVTAPSNTIVFVRNVGQASCTATTSTVTVPAGGVASGDTLILRLMLRNNSAGAVVASDSKGNTYVADKDFTNIDQRIVVLSARVGSALAAGDTITVTHPNASSKGVVVDEFSGLASSSPVDVTGSGSGNSTAPSASLTTGNATDLVLGAVSEANVQSVTQPGGWSALTTQGLSCGGGANGNSSNFGAYRVTASTGTYTYNPTVSNGSRWGAAAVGYRGAPPSIAGPGVPSSLSGTHDSMANTNTLTWTAPASSIPAVDFYRIYRDGTDYTNRIDATDATASTLSGATPANATALTVAEATGFAVGQSIAVDTGASQDNVTISAVAGNMLTVAAMTHAHAVGVPVSLRTVSWTDTDLGGSTHSYYVTAVSANLAESNPFLGPTPAL